LPRCADYVAVGVERSIRVTTSVGVALFGGVMPAELMDNVDHAMHDAKAAGRTVSQCSDRPLSARRRYPVGIPPG
jgi:GGDEF domain-containing protein